MTAAAGDAMNTRASSRRKCIDSLQKAFINPLKLSGALFMMDGCTSLDFKIWTAIHCHYKAWKSQDIFKYNSNSTCLKEESHIPLGWLEGRFHWNGLPTALGSRSSMQRANREFTLKGANLESL